MILLMSRCSGGEQEQLMVVVVLDPKVPIEYEFGRCASSPPAASQLSVYLMLILLFLKCY